MNREELLKIAKPILFNTEMVQAILDNRKTVTRRTIKKWSDYDEMIPCKTGFWKEFNERDGITYIKDYNFSPSWWSEKEYIKRKAPYQVGEILYIRETWQHNPVGIGWAYDYKASPENNSMEHEKWRPSIHMPKKAARIFLKVTDVRVERLQDITISDIEKEGYPYEVDFSNMPIAMQGIMFEWFVNLWNSTIKKQDIDKYSLEANPWVWVIEFERISE